MKSSNHGLFFVGRFLITDSMSLLVVDLFRFFISSEFRLVRLYTPRNLSTSSRLVIYFLFLHLIIHSGPWGSCVFVCGISCNVSSFISSCFFAFSLFIFFLVGLPKGLLFILKIQFLVSLVFSLAILFHLFLL